VIGHVPLPDFATASTLTSAADGPWDDPLTWGGRVPTAADVVAVTHHVTVMPGVAAVAAVIQVRSGGVLEMFPVGPPSLRVSTLQVLSSGQFRAGSLLSPASGEVVFVPGDLGPEQWGCGLLVEGKVRVYGHRKAPFLRCARPPKVGDSYVPLKGTPWGWRVGDRVVIPDTNRYNPPDVGNQYRIVADVREGGVVLDAPLDYSPPCPKEEDGSYCYLPHLANLTRSFVFRSESPVGVRGHSAATVHADWRVENAAFLDMGRTHKGPLGPGNQIGRYAVHFHHLTGPVHQTAGSTTEDGYQFKLCGCVVERATKWPVAVHGSHWGQVADNVVWDAELDGIATEDGSETGVLFEGNFVGLIREGSGFWHVSTNCRTRNNVIANCKINGEKHASGGVYYDSLLNRYPGESPRIPDIVMVPKFPGAHHDGDLRPLDWYFTPVLECKGNEAYNAGPAVAIDHRKSQRGYYGTTQHVVTDTTAWHSWGSVVAAYDTRGLLVLGATVRNNINHWGFAQTSDSNIVVVGLDIYMDKDAGGGVGLVFNSNSPSDLEVSHSKIVAPKPVETYMHSVDSGGDNVRQRKGKHLLLHGVKLAQPPGVAPQPLIFSAGPQGGPVYGTPTVPAGSAQPCVPYTVTVERFQGVYGWDFQVTLPEQAADALCPWTGLLSQNPNFPRQGCPEQGLTNAEAFRKYGLWVCGGLG
jgi:hypothetical protein